ncbi:MAG: TIGR04053 family radical SAM/SPASM domain-containing protein [Chlamydiota bacterium]|nr:TIGR04053 family radical SAM/SPASM domain-containing protein [Chlamydiota bacterium]
MDFSKAPFLVIWEVTRACALECQHCRAEAIDKRNPFELNLEEGYRLIDEVAQMGTPIIIFTGGDPLQRDDLEQLVWHAKSRKLRVGTIPASTDRLTRERILSLKEAGLDQIALSLDGETQEKHDQFRQVDGSFRKVMQGVQWAHEIGMPLQINTVFGSWNFDDFDAIADLVDQMKVVFWEVFFLVPTGRGTQLKGCTPEQCEEIFKKIYQRSLHVQYLIKITEGQHYRRYLKQVEEAGGTVKSHPGHVSKSGSRIGTSTMVVNSGKGFCFVDHLGDISPSGFLPLVAGNVKKDSITDIYRNSNLFMALRDMSLLKGRCGRCEYKEICGGSRARAFALTGDYLEEDASCGYMPQLKA